MLYSLYIVRNMIQIYTIYEFIKIYHSIKVYITTSLTFALPFSAIFTNACAILGVFHVSTQNTSNAVLPRYLDMKLEKQQVYISIINEAIRK